MKILRIFLLIIPAFYMTSVLAIEPFVVEDIRVEGVQRTEAGTVFNYLSVKVGETMTEEKSAQAVKSLFSTGLFSDVRIEQDGNVLLVWVQERPAIAQINFSGNSSFPSDKMKEGMKQVGLAEGMTFDRAMLDRAEQEIKRQYLSQGKYGAQVKTIVSPMVRNRVAVHFDIDEGTVAKIKSINIVGAKAFDESELLDEFQLSTSNWMSWWNQDDQYSKQKLSADIETLRSFYLDQGYMDFSVDSTQVSITPDKRDIYITLSINEGEKYTVTDVKVAGEILVPKDELSQLITVAQGDIFNRQKITESSKAIADRLGNDGYAFANVNVVPEVDQEQHTASFTFFIEPGRRIYVRRINIAGNTRTQDEVLRREMRQPESSVYDASKIMRSKQRLDRLNYFDDVNFETPAVAGTTDQVDINVDVVEKSTGSILFGAGLSSAEGVVLGITVNQSNFLGSGNHVSAQVNTGKVNTTYSFSFTDPYFTPDGVSRGFDVYRKDVDTSSLNIGQYKSSSYGAGIRFGIPLNERDSVGIGLTADYTSLDLNSKSPQRYTEYCENTRGCNDTSLRLDLSWTHDTRDNILFPNEGVLQRISTEIGLPGLDQEYYKINYQHSWFKGISEKLVLMLNGEVGYAGSYGSKKYPFFKNFYAGGVTSVRGYDQSTLGPHDYDSVSRLDYAIGGTRRIVGNAEVFFPIPFVKESRQWRLSTFFDFGSVWGGDNTNTSRGCDDSVSDCLRYSAGVGLSWYSPFGPLKLVFAKALNDEPGDNTQVLQFQLGSQF